LALGGQTGLGWLTTPIGQSEKRQKKKKKVLAHWVVRPPPKLALGVVPWPTTPTFIYLKSMKIY